MTKDQKWQNLILKIWIPRFSDSKPTRIHLKIVPNKVPSTIDSHKPTSYPFYFLNLSRQKIKTPNPRSKLPSKAPKRPHPYKIILLSFHKQPWVSPLDSPICITNERNKSYILGPWCEVLPKAVGEQTSLARRECWSPKRRCVECSRRPPGWS